MRFFILITFFLLISNSHAFTSVIGNQPRRGYDIHSQITYAVLEKFNFSYISFREVVSGNVSNDYYKNLVLDASRHCDRNFQVSHEMAFEKCRTTFHFLLKDSVKEAKSKNYLRSLYRFGQALHVAQDLISHSNFIKLNEKNKQKILGIFFNIENKPIKDIKFLKLTYWQEDDMKNKKNRDSFSHVEFSLDHPKLNSWSRKRDENNITHFKLAFNSAKGVTEKVLDMFLSQLNNEQKKNIKNYNR